MKLEINRFLRAFYFNSSQTEGILQLGYGLKRRFSRPGQHIFVACFPKSGSTFLTRVLTEVTGYKFVPFIAAFGRNEHDLYEPRLYDHYSVDTVTQQHCRATPMNLKLMHRYGIKPVILVRNIFDCIVSLRDHIYTETGLWPMAYVNRDFFALSESQQYDFIIDMFLPWYLDFYVSWSDFTKEQGASRCTWITYEHLMNDRLEALKDLLKGLEVSDSFISQAIERVTGTGKENSRLNKGVSGRGQEKLSLEQKERIRSRANLYFANIDFTMIGL